MSVANSAFERFGELDLPVVAADVGTTLDALDPAVHNLTELFKAAINAEYGDVWTKVTATLTAGHPLIGTSPVQDTLELEPTKQVMTQRKASWPLLCLHRTGTGTTEPHTMQLDRLTQPWSLHYILGPLDVGDLHKLAKICVAAAATVRMVIRNRGHLAYQSGALQFFPGSGTYFSEINLKNQQGPGQAAFGDDGDKLLYYAVTLALETVEITEDKPEALPNLDGVMYEVGVGSSDGVLPGLIYADTDAPLQGG